MYNFDATFSGKEFTASALVDLEMHVLEDTQGFDGPAFEKQVLQGLEMPTAVIMRHRTPHFQHVFAGDGYSAGYYSYMWSEVMDADAFKAFEETGDVFDKERAKALRTHVYAAGGSVKPEELYTRFRGRLPGVEALLEQRGLSQDAA